MNPAATPSFAPPSPNAIRIEGILDMVRASDSSFTVITENGASVPGQLTQGRSIEDLARCLNEGVVLFGIGQFDETGTLRSVEATGFLPGIGPRRRRSQQLAGRTPEEREEMARRLKSVVGTWPGTEPDEEIERAVQELR